MIDMQGLFTHRSNYASHLELREKNVSLHKPFEVGFGFMGKLFQYFGGSIGSKQEMGRAILFYFGLRRKRGTGSRC
jgi:hypothetical protein